MPNLPKYAGAARKKQRLETAQKSLRYPSSQPRRKERGAFLAKSLEAHRSGQGAAKELAKTKAPPRGFVGLMGAIGGLTDLANLHLTGRRLPERNKAGRDRAVKKRIDGLLAKGKAQQELSSLQGKGSFAKMDAGAEALQPKAKVTIPETSQPKAKAKVTKRVRGAFQTIARKLFTRGK